MSLISYARGQTGIVVRVKILNSAATDGSGKTGLTRLTSGLAIAAIVDNEATTTSYTSAGATIEDITTLGTYAAPSATKCRFKEVDATYHKGVYEVHLADARYAVTSAKYLLLSISGGTGVAETDVVIPLTDMNPYDSVRAGLTALPNAAAGAATGVLTGARILAAPRALDAVADAATTVDDALWAAVCGAAGKEVKSGTSYVVKTPFTGTVIRSFSLDSSTAPTTRS